MENQKVHWLFVLFIGILGFLLCSVSAFPQSLSWDLSWEHYTSAAKRTFKQGNYEEAEKLLKASLNKTNKFGKTDYRISITYSNLALIYQIQKKFDRAETYYTKSLNLKRRTLRQMIRA